MIYLGGGLILKSKKIEKNTELNTNNRRLLKVLKALFKNKLAIFGFIIIFIQLIMAIFAPLLATYDPTVQDLAKTNLAIGSEGHWLGTDNYGRDVWSRLVFGARISLLVGLFATAVGLFFGTILGCLSGYYKKLDSIIMRIVDLMFAFPSILLAMLIIAILGSNLVNVAIAISIWSIPSYARVIRGNVLTIKNQEYINVLKTVGASDLRILIKHILPNSLAVIIVIGTMNLASVILSTAALSYLGLGAQPPTPEWGAMIAEGQKHMWNAPHLAIIPGLAIMLVVIAFNILGDALRDILDPNLNENI